MIFGLQRFRTFIWYLYNLPPITSNSFAVNFTMSLASREFVTLFPVMAPRFLI